MSLSSYTPTLAIGASIPRGPIVSIGLIVPNTSQVLTVLRDKIKVPIPEFFSREKGKLEYFLF